MRIYGGLYPCHIYNSYAISHGSGWRWSYLTNLKNSPKISGTKKPTSCCCGVKGMKKKTWKNYIYQTKSAVFWNLLFLTLTHPIINQQTSLFTVSSPKTPGKKKHIGSSTNRIIFPVVVGRSPRCQAKVWRDTPVSSLLDLRAEGYKLHIKSMDFWCFFSNKGGKETNF